MRNREYEGQLVARYGVAARRCAIFPSVIPAIRMSALSLRWRGFMRALSFLALILACLPVSQSLAGTIIMGRTDARECYLATLAESSPAGDKRGLDACDRAVDADNGDVYTHAAILVN